MEVSFGESFGCTWTDLTGRSEGGLQCALHSSLVSWTVDMLWRRLNSDNRILQFGAFSTGLSSFMPDLHWLQWRSCECVSWKLLRTRPSPDFDWSRLVTACLPQSLNIHMIERDEVINAHCEMTRIECQVIYLFCGCPQSSRRIATTTHPRILTGRGLTMKQTPYLMERMFTNISA